jgi:hypothetical protein
MKTTAEIGIKIGAGTRDFYRYTGRSAELERRGAGSSRPELAWVRRAVPTDLDRETLRTTFAGNPEIRE